MLIATKNALTSRDQLVVDWSTLAYPQNGGASITSYNLQWDAGTSGVSWFSLIGLTTPFTGTSFTVTSGVA